MSKSPNLQVRLDPQAHQHLQEIVESLHASGRNISMANYVSTLILTQPIPNGHKLDPCEEEEKDKP
jgi:enamine deaminase RidA (YjgF/YER057c/UK114 family)